MPRIPLIATGLALTLLVAPGCERDADPLLCGDLAAGDLVITEVRGGPSITDNDGQWIELYNASAATIDLHGLALTIDTIGGGSHDRLLIRRPQQIVAGGYAVLGKFADTGRPAHVDVGWGTTPAIPRAGAIAISCGLDIDRIVFTSLPDPAQVTDPPPNDPAGAGHGTYALGAMPPTATANDDAGAWCADGTETHSACSPDCIDIYKGSPKQPNPACPPP